MKLAMYESFSRIARESGWSAAADAAIKLGCTHVELIEVDYPMGKNLIKDVTEAKSIRKFLEEKGLSVACYSVFANLYESREAIESLKVHAELAAALGSPFLHHTLLPWFETTEGLPEFDAAIASAVDGAAEVASHAKKFGVTCIYEDQGFFANGIEGYGKFYSELKSRCDNVGVCGDMGNSLFVDVTGAEFFEAYIDDILHVHAKDYFRKYGDECPGKGWYRSAGGAWLSDAPLGEGIAEVKRCLEILEKAGYRGVVAMESPFREHAADYLLNNSIY